LPSPSKPLFQGCVFEVFSWARNPKEDMWLPERI
jgi:hypothetical protein